MNAFACRVSGAGEAALALIEVWGPDATRVVPASSTPAVRHMGDEVVVRAHERGFTGDPTVMVSCHGGTAAIDAVLDELRKRGAVVVPAKDRILQAWKRGAVDRPRAEAYWRLPAARTLRAARMLADQWGGALGRDLAAGRIEALLRTSPLGVALVTPPRVVLWGPPNAGKSTLFNALMERERALVSAVPGTTRDPVSDRIAIDGIPIELVDTAGIEEARDELEVQAMGRTRLRAGEADLVLRVNEAGSEPSHESGLQVWTKTDLRSPQGPGIAVAALQKTGLEDLRKAIVRELGLDVPAAEGQGMIFTRRQREEIGRDPRAYVAGEPDLD